MADVFLIVALLLNLRLMASGRMSACISWVALQGALISAYALPAHWPQVDAELLIVTAASLVLKGWFFPRTLRRAMRRGIVEREMDPFVGYVASLLVGLFSLWLCHWISLKLVAANPHLSPLVITCALTCVVSGLFLIIARRKIVVQAVGYLVIDNGLFALGISAFAQTSFLIELGLILNLCVAVFVRAVLIFNLNRVFHHMDSTRLSTLQG